MNRILHVAAVAAYLVLPASASTFVIDDDGGPGVDFPDIPHAIAAAQPGDVLLVRPGSYSSFLLLSKGLSILCDEGVTIEGSANVSWLPRDQIALLAGFTAHHSGVWNCQGTVILQRVRAEFNFTQSVDVRLWGVDGVGYLYLDIWEPHLSEADDAPGLFTRDSRVEVVQSRMLGRDAPNDPDIVVKGFPGILAQRLSIDAPGRLHLALSSATGGRGGASTGFSGRGGHGLIVAKDFGYEVLIAGGVVEGGQGATPTFPNCAGAGGTALYVENASARYSGVELTAGEQGPGTCGLPGQELFAADPSYVFEPAYPDPTLGVMGIATAGSVLTFEIRAHPRSKAFLNYGKTPIVGPEAPGQIGALVDTIRGIKLGAIPVSGSVTRAFPIPSNASVGSLFIFQGVVALPNGEVRRTNSIPVIVR